MLNKIIPYARYDRKDFADALILLAKTADL